MSTAVDKKIKTLMEVVPRLDEAEARRLLEKSGGSVNKASDMALEGGDWTSAAAKKKPTKKDDTKKDVAPRRDEKKTDRPVRREFVERKPRGDDIKPEAKKTEAAPTTVVVVASKSKVETGISFADMIKRQKQQPEPVVEAVPEPVIEAAPAPKDEEVAVEVPVTAQAVEEVAAPVAEAPKPKKEKKEPKKKAAALPQKYEAEIDRAVAVNLPANIVELATDAFTFSSEPGRAPTPPRQPQQQVHHQQVTHQTAHQQGDWSHHRQQQQTVQRNWNQEGNYNNRNQHFTNDWRQQRNNGYDTMGYNNRMGNQQQQQYRQEAYNNNVMRAAPQQTQANQNFW